MTTRKLPRICLIGLPGTGKSSLSEGLSAHFGIKTFSVGEILRNPERYPGIEDIIGSYNVHSGILLSNQGVCDIVEPLLTGEPGWVVDGVPRKVGQLTFMEQKFPPDLYIILECPYTVIWDRIVNRSRDENARKDDALPTFLTRMWQYDLHTRPVVSALRASPVIRSHTIVQSETTTIEETLAQVIQYAEDAISK